LITGCQRPQAEKAARLQSGNIGLATGLIGAFPQQPPEYIALFHFSYPQYFMPGEFPKDIFSMRARRRSGAGLVQQTVQIVDRFAITI
jgi:hypothetical protein